MREYVFQGLMDKEDGGAPSGGSRSEQIGDEPSDDNNDPNRSGDDDDEGSGDEGSEDDDDPDKDEDEDEIDDEDEDEKPKGGKGKNKDRDDTDRIARIAAGVAAGMHARQPNERQQPKELTDAEVKKILNVYEIDNDTVKDMLGLDKDDEVKPSQLKAAQRMVAGIIKNATTVSNATTTAMMKKLEQRLSQYDEFMATTRQEQAHQKFFQRYDYLKPYEKIVAAVATNLAQSDPTWAERSFEDGAKQVAREVRRILKDSGIQVSKRKSDDEANHGAEPEVRGNGVPRMPQLAGSGRSSTSGSRGKQSSDDEAVYGKGNENW